MKRAQDVVFQRRARGHVFAAWANEGVNLMDTWLTKIQLVEKTHLSYTSIWKMIVAGDFPRGKQVGRQLLWRASDVDGWIDGRPDQVVQGDEVERPAGHLNLKHVGPTTATVSADERG